MSFPSKALLDALTAHNTTIISSSRVKDSLTISAEQKYSTLPAFLRVELESRPHENSYIRHELWLPDDWNGCFVGTGNAGMGGKILYPGLVDHIRLGYAVINTDLGSSRGRKFGNLNPEVRRDTGWRATYLMTEVGKLITEAYFGRPISHAYFCGSSTGGFQAMMLAQRYPDAYNAISAGVPAHNRVSQSVYFIWGFNTIRQAGVSFSTEELNRITAHAVAFGRENGLVDEGDPFVTRPYVTPEIIERFIAYLRANDHALSAAQCDVLRLIYLGPVDPRNGKRIYTGLPLGAESRGAGERYELLGWQKKEPARFWDVSWAFGEDFTADRFDYAADTDRLLAALREDKNANNTDLRPFFARGGKLFLYSGAADPIIPFPETVKYVEGVMETAGTEAALDGMRYFILPGQDHLAEVALFGPAVMNGTVEITSQIEILRLWHEQGIAPDCFETATKVNDICVRKTVYAYGTPQNPHIECIASDPAYR